MSLAPNLQVCFVRRHQSGYELARKLKTNLEELWRLNPHIADVNSVWGGELLLVSRYQFRRPTPWELANEDFVLQDWPWGREDFANYPCKDDFLDRNWTPPHSPGLTPIVGVGPREAKWGRFDYVDAPVGDDKDAIRITDGWEGTNIGSVHVPGLAGMLIPAKKPRYSDGKMQFNKKCHRQLVGLWSDWVRYDMIRHVRTYIGAFVPRYMRDATHIRANLSNHAWGTAFDINYEWNRLKHPPARMQQLGCVMDLVEVAHKWGFFWGGHFGGGRVDGMHFEVAKVL